MQAALAQFISASNTFATGKRAVSSSACSTENHCGRYEV